MTKSEVAVAVGRALQRYLRERDRGEPAASAELSRRERLVAAANRAVPLLRDLFETVYLRCDGSFFAWDNDTPDQTTAIRDIDPEQSRTCLLMWGSRRHPELAELLPPREGDARDCDACAGTGRGRDVDMCYLCSGLGWRSR
jgi:hypothetical protein